MFDSINVVEKRTVEMDANTAESAEDSNDQWLVVVINGLKIRTGT